MKTSIKSYPLTVLQSYLLFTICMLLSIQPSNGQGKNEEVTIIAPYIPSIGDATKIPFRPEITPDDQANPTFEYDYVTKSHETSLELDPLEPMKYSEGKQEQFYRNYAKAGFGNYITPYLDFMASSLQNDKYQFGARLNYYSSQGKIKNYPPSAYSHGLISVFGRTFSKNHTLSADIGYERDVVHFYGFSPDSFPDVTFDKEDIKQRFQHIHGNMEYGSNYREKYKLNHHFGLGLHYFSDYYETRESQVSFITNLDKAFKASGNNFIHSFALDLGLDLLSYKDSVSSARPVFFLIRPVYRLGFGQYRFEAGLDINIENGVDVFPILKAEVDIVEDKFKAYAEFSGNRTINSFRSLAGMNPFIISTPTVTYTDEQIRFGGGIAGNAGGMNFMAEAFYSYFNDMPLFVNDNTLTLENRFDVIYDNLNLLNIKASLGYTKINQLSARLFAAYFHYIPKNEEKAWQLPNYEVGLDAGYTFQEKYTIKFSALALGLKYARTYDDNNQLVPEKIDAALDLGAGFEYQVNDMIAAFVDVNNILNQNYQRWYHYPVQGILVMAGVKISF